MPELSSNDAKRPELVRRSELAWTVAQIAVVWVAADLGYYFLLPALGVNPGYNAGSVAVAIYYAFWVGIAVITFWPLYAIWPHYGRWATFESRYTSYIVWSVFFAGFVAFAVYVLPLLPPTTWTESFSPPEVRVATEWYFLPKSIEILFQQLLVVALVLALSVQQFPLRRISLYCGLIFGAAHVLLVFGDTPTGYVIRFMLAATAFGFAFPYLILKVRNGFAYSYVVHWLYYAVTVAMPHFFANGAFYLLFSAPAK
jgi:hypothetical protein